ncbi:hypothetical protein CR513_39012, partial [Mucuna pruriens]
MALSEYDIVYLNQKAIKGSALAEHLAYHPITDYQPLLHEFQNEHIMVVTENEPGRYWPRQKVNTSHSRHD